MSSELPIGLRDIEAARKRLAGHAVGTPLLSSPVLDERAAGRVFLKAENLQRTGSFKFRGAFNRLNLISDDRRRFGVVASSSGNHAQGVAAAAAILGIPATIVMPSDAPAVKQSRTRSLGATIVPYDRATDDRWSIANDIAEKQGATFVHPYDDPGVMAGQGTVGLEIVRQCRAAGVAIDQVLVCCGGGGLTAGTSLAVTETSPTTSVYTVEPAGFDDHARSFDSGSRVRNPSRTGSICDALMAERPGAMTFQVTSERVTGGLVVSDTDAMEAVAYAFNTFRIVLEPGGAVALAAILTGKIETRDRTTVAVLSGGNIDPALLDEALHQR